MVPTIDRDRLSPDQHMAGFFKNTLSLFLDQVPGRIFGMPFSFGCVMKSLYQKKIVLGPLTMLLWLLGLHA